MKRILFLEEKKREWGKRKGQRGERESEGYKEKGCKPG
jgi:hypothetical protein